MPTEQRRRDAGQIQSLARVVLTPPFRFFWKVTVEGIENIPTTGGAIIAPNHISVLDSFFVPLVLPRRVTYVGKAEYMDDWKTKWIFPAIGMIPIDRAGGNAAQAALDVFALPAIGAQAQKAGIQHPRLVWLAGFDRVGDL